MLYLYNISMLYGGKSASVPDGPARVVFGQEGQVVLDALEVFPLLALSRVRVAVEGEANDL